MISVITPVYRKSLTYLPETWASLLAQNDCGRNWEWVLGLNNGAQAKDLPREIAGSARVRLVRLDDELDANGCNKIGRLKHQTFSAARGDLLVELDADDLLTPDALSCIADAFADSQVQMAYSNAAEFEHATWKPRVYDPRYGWQSAPFEFQGHALIQMVGWEPSPHMLRQIYWAPNHVRAWRAQAYHALGGHDAALAVGDDHDLCCRTFLTYGANGMKFIERCLYLYRVHGQNSWLTNNEAIQSQTQQNYLKYICGMATRWARDKNWRRVDLGGRFNAWGGYETVDRLDADAIADLNGRFPFDDDSVGVIHAAHIFEHLRNPVHTMNECYRVLAPGGFLFIEVPSTDGRGAWQDPTHVSFWNQNSFWYYTNRNFARFIRPEYVGYFQCGFVATFFPGDFEKQNDIPFVRADLIAQKPPYSNRPVGEVLI